MLVGLITAESQWELPKLAFSPQLNGLDVIQVVAIVALPSFLLLNGVPYHEWTGLFTQ